MTALESVPLDEVLRDVLGGVKIVDGLQLEDLTAEQMGLVMIKVQRMRRAKIEQIKEQLIDMACVYTLDRRIDNLLRELEDLRVDILQADLPGER